MQLKTDALSCQDAQASFSSILALRLMAVIIYNDVILMQQMLPSIHFIAGDAYVFQQDSAVDGRAASA